MKRYTALLGCALALACAAAHGQSPAPASPDAAQILTKALAVYTNAKTYQGNWTFTQQLGEIQQKAVAEIKAKGPTRVYYHLSPAPGQKPQPGIDTLPELLVTLDGKTAWFQNNTDSVYYQVALPKNAAGSPLMFFPQIRAVSGVQTAPSITEDGKTFYVLQAATPNGGQSRMVIDTGTFRVRRMIQEEMYAGTLMVSTISVDKETFDAPVPDSAFVFKAAKGAREIPAPLGAAALFGPPDQPSPAGATGTTGNAGPAAEPAR